MIELMITLAIVAILLTVGVPSLKTFMQGNQLIASTNELVSALHIARSEAIKLNTRVSICESNDGATCGTTGNWENGWIVFVDGNGASPGDLVNTGSSCSGSNTDCLLRVHNGFNDNQLTVGGVDTNTAGVINAFTFTSRGLPKISAASPAGTSQGGVFSICSLDDAGAIISSRAVTLSVSGRVRASTNTAVITCP
ncbi:Type IV fimbrial biogenesis protein FimT [hydrothermal vent metagenome]|uniref:Type IV fimbrial biogenesis protein FimT n=1 Tax=hydrothermal vent metagenome TaxID=652676 RepID=A0A3B0XBU6_9ZZZZ